VVTQSRVVGSPSHCPPPPLSDHLLSDDQAEDRNLHSLSSIVESIAVEDVAVTFPEERVQN